MPRIQLLSLAVLLYNTRSVAFPKQRHSILRAAAFSTIRMSTSELSISRLGDYSSVSYRIFDQGVVVDTPFDQGDVNFVINGGGLNPNVHAFAETVKMGETKSGSISGGEYFEQMAADISIEQAPPGLVVNDVVRLSNGLRARVTRVTDTKIRIDANPPLAGKTLQIEMSCRTRSPASSLSQATFAAGCFWGLELALQRVLGVAYTAVGYTQGQLASPSYEQVCSGSTGHTEAVTVLFDPKIVNYAKILDVFWDRHDPTQKNRQGNDVGTQYRGGIYYHSLEQRMEAEASMKVVQSRYKVPLATELLPASTFWLAEDYHQQYLEKNGQSAKKSATELIRCYG